MKIERLGPYRIVRELGRGGMGTVYEGVHSETNEPAAVKLLSATLAGEADFRERFAAEIDALRKLNHPNIVRLFGFGRQDDHLFYAMELVDGCSLEQELQRGRRFNWREVTRIGIETCRALRHAHDRGVVHRDIKPANLLMAADGRVKLSDFGIARLFGNVRLTNVGSVLGTAEYMAPEQAEGKPVGPRADLYSLGAVFYVLLTNRPLFAAKSFAEMLRKQRVETPDPLARHAPDVPEALQAIVAQLLEKDPDRRIPNPAVLTRQLEAMEQALSLEPAPGGPGAMDAEDAENGEDAESPTSELPAADDRPSSGAELPETRATGAFQRPGTENPAETKPEPGSRFTPVAAEELDRIESGTSRPPWRLLQTWALLIGLIAVCLAGWYLLQPLSAEALYEKIARRTGGETIASLKAAENDMRQFLRRFPADPRGEKLRRYLRKVELHDLEQKLKLRAKGLGGGESLAPIERDYLEAIHDVQVTPELAMAKLRALVDLYDQGPETPHHVADCVELARNQLVRLDEPFAAQAAERLDRVSARLEAAGEIRPTNPQRARAMYRAVIELYQNKPWAADAVRRAREALDEDPAQHATISEKPKAEAAKPP